MWLPIYPAPPATRTFRCGITRSPPIHVLPPSEGGRNSRSFFPSRWIAAPGAASPVCAVQAICRDGAAADHLSAAASRMVFELEPVSLITCSASSRIVNSPGFPRLTGPVNDGSVAINC